MIEVKGCGSDFPLSVCLLLLSLSLDFIMYTFLLIPNTISPSELPWGVDTLVMIPSVEKRLRGSETSPGSPAGRGSSWPSPSPSGVFLSHSPVRTCLICVSRPCWGRHMMRAHPEGAHSLAVKKGLTWIESTTSLLELQGKHE